MKEEDIQHVMWNYDQLCKIVRPDSMKGMNKLDKLKPVDDIIKRELPALLKEVAPPNIYELLGDFEAEYDKFKDFIVYDELIGKKIVGLGGGFSSGKSSFLNCLMGGEEILPAKIDPSTSVPTYIVYGQENKVKAINIFDACVELDLFAINQIAHGFGAVGIDEEYKTEVVTLGHILKNLFLETNMIKYDNLVFLDTPGYSKPESDKYSSKTDEKIARAQLNTADIILWFMSCEEGSLNESDIKFLKSLNQEIPITIICSKVGRQDAEQDKIRNNIKEKILIENLNVQNIFFFEKENPDKFDRKLIDSEFAKWNKEVQEKETFAKHFKRLFWECRNYYRQKKDEANAEVRNLKNALMHLGDEPDVSKYIERVLDHSEKENAIMEKAQNEMLRLQTQFFREIKGVADSVHIDMPEPKDIDVLEDRIKNPLTEIREYNKTHKKQVNTAIKDEILDSLRDVTIEFECQPGGEKYKEKMTQLLNDDAFPKEDQILFGKEINTETLLKSCKSEGKS